MTNAKGRPSPEILVTPQEITELMDKAGTMEDMERAKAIEQEFISRYGLTVTPSDCFDYYSMLANVYQAGRLQGIREQRKARK